MADIQLSGVAPVGGAVAAKSPSAFPAAPAPASAAADGSAGAVAGGVAGPFKGVDGAAAGADAGKTSAAAGPDSKVKEAAKEAVKGANAALAASGTLLVFVFDDQAHHMAVKLLDVQTQKVVQQIPLQHMPATASALSGDTASGALVDTKA